MDTCRLRHLATDSVTRALRSNRRPDLTINPDLLARRGKTTESEAPTTTYKKIKQQSLYDHSTCNLPYNCPPPLNPTTGDQTVRPNRLTMSDDLSEPNNTTTARAKHASNSDCRRCARVTRPLQHAHHLRQRATIAPALLQRLLGVTHERIALQRLVRAQKCLVS